MAPTDEFDSWVRVYLEPGHPPIVPEVVTLSARRLTPLWEAIEHVDGEACEPPYWAFSWPGSQAIARYVLDHADVVRGQTVLDLGAGNGLAAVACALAGARRVIANDVDDRASRMTRLIASHNAVEVEVESVDRLAATAGDRSVTLVLVGDLFYSRILATRVRRFLRLQQESGSRVLIGEPGRNFALTEEVEDLATYRVPVSRELEDRAWVETRVLRLRDGVRDDRV